MYIAPIFGKSVRKRCNHITAPPLKPIQFCLVLISAPVSRAVGFYNLFRMKGNLHGISQQPASPS